MPARCAAIASLAYRLPAGIEQRIASLFGSEEFLRPSLELKHASNAHGAIFMEKIVAAAFLDAEQQIQIA